MFRDPLASIFDDPDHSEGEHREIIIGHSLTGVLLLVSFTEHEEDVIRLISARTTDAAERRTYEETL